MVAHPSNSAEDTTVYQDGRYVAWIMQMVVSVEDRSVHIFLVGVGGIFEQALVIENVHTDRNHNSDRCRLLQGV